MSKRIAVAVVLAILAAVLIRALTQEHASSIPHTQNIESIPLEPNPFVPSSVPTDDPPQSFHTSGNGEETLASSESTTTRHSRLRALEQAAHAGSAKAQFRLSNAMRHCTTVLAYSEDDIRSMTDLLRRSHLLQSQDECRYFADRRERLVDEAFDWERRATDAGDPGARAMQIGMQVDNGDLQAEQAEENLRPLLASNDPFVFATIARLSMAAGINAESAAWHMLACEDEGPPELCSILNGALSDGCTGTVRCGNAGHDVDVAQYYMHTHPELFDLARGRYQELKDRLQNGRGSEIELHLDTFSGE